MVRHFNVNVKPLLYLNALPASHALTRKSASKVIQNLLVPAVTANGPNSGGSKMIPIPLSCVRTPHMTEYCGRPLLFIGYGLELSIESAILGVGLRSLVPLCLGDPITEYEVSVSFVRGVHVDFNSDSYLDPCVSCLAGFRFDKARGYEDQKGS